MQKGIKIDSKGKESKPFLLQLMDQLEQVWNILQELPQYPHTNSPNWSLCISLKNELREFDKRSRHFLLGDHFINSHNLISWQCMDIVRRKLLLVTIGTWRVNCNNLLCIYLFVLQYKYFFHCIIFTPNIFIISFSFFVRFKMQVVSTTEMIFFVFTLFWSVIVCRKRRSWVQRVMRLSVTKTLPSFTLMKKHSSFSCGLILRTVLQTLISTLDSCFL